MTSQCPPTDPLVALVDTDTQSIRSTGTGTNGVEKAGPLDDNDTPAGSLGRQTAFANLGKKETIKLFWRPLMYCGFALFGVMMDGFQMSLPGKQASPHQGSVHGTTDASLQDQSWRIAASSINLVL